MSAPEPVSAFMQRALYDPQRGYYTANIRTVGSRGDFSTTATLSPRLGQAVAAWITEQRKATDLHTVIEIGGGDGSLMAQVLKSLGWWRSRRLLVFMVEASPVLMQRQKQRLGAACTWFQTLPEALAACEGRALIYHNELLDAFPVDLVDGWEQTWHSVLLDRAGRESHAAVTVPDDERSDFSVLRAAPQQAQRCELHTTLRAWLKAWLPLWKEGAMLAIDYGDLFPALYHRRPRGTLRAYLLHQRLEGPEVYANAGRQDITCDVNFTDVRAWLQGGGCQEQFYLTQATFLDRYAPQKTASPQDAHLADLQGAGSAFQCLSVRQ